MDSQITLPEKFLELLRESIGDERSQFYLKSFSEEPSASIRLNPAKWGVENIDQLFPDLKTGPVPNCKNGFYLDRRPSFTMDPLFHAGVYYVQEASSMSIEKLVKIFSDRYIRTQDSNEHLKILDLCAAPGGKSTHLLSLFDQDSTLFILNEVIRSRVITLADNVAKWGHSNVVVTNNDASDFKPLRGYFDLIVADLPCSGEGMFRKDNNAIKEWSYDNVMLSSARQRRIISDVWSSLKPGGYMIYSTCTFNRYENEENIEWICKNLDAEQVPEATMQFIPGIDRGEGFFCSLLFKIGDRSHFEKSNKKVLNKNLITSRKIDDIATQYINGEYKCLADKELIKAYPQALEKDMLFISSSLRRIYSGVAIGELISSRNKAEQFIPHPDLALSTSFNQDSFDKYELTYEEAIKYLSLEPLILRDTSEGYILLTYKDTPLGFVKNLGNRTNNLWPKARRILKR